MWKPLFWYILGEALFGEVILVDVALAFLVRCCVFGGPLLVGPKHQHLSGPPILIRVSCLGEPLVGW